MTDNIESTMGDSHRAAALLKAAFLGDEDTYRRISDEAQHLGRIEYLPAPLVAIATRFVTTMIDKGAIDAASVTEWFERIESMTIAAELDEDGR